MGVSPGRLLQWQVREMSQQSKGDWQGSMQSRRSESQPRVTPRQRDEELVGKAISKWHNVESNLYLAKIKLSPPKFVVLYFRKIYPEKVSNRTNLYKAFCTKTKGIAIPEQACTCILNIALILFIYDPGLYKNDVQKDWFWASMCI